MRLQLPWCVVAVSHLAAAATRSEAADAPHDFDWASIAPSTDLEYHDCHDGFQCARLVLPMDWLNHTNQANVTIAITKLPAAVSDDDATFGGTIFSQPGGPGGSGTLYGRNVARRHQSLFDKPGKKHYEILSFDPRGMGHSAPRIDCFPGLLGYMRDLERFATGSAGPTPETLAMAVAAAKADGARCDEVHGEFLSYVGTPYVARDMLAIVDKIEEHRIAHGSRPDEEEDRLELRSEKEEKKNKRGLPRLQYVGVSYGTTIGQFFASMFPGRMGRMVLDGVVDVDDLTNGLEGLIAGQDVDEIVDLFFQGCFAAGQSTCALAHDQDSSGADIQRRVWEWIDTLDEYPIAASLSDGNRVFLTAMSVRAMFVQSAYSPLAKYQPLALALEEAMQGNTTLLTSQYTSQLNVPQGSNLANYTNDPLIPMDGLAAVNCVDSIDVTGHDNLYWRSVLRKHTAISSVAGSFWAGVRVSCAGWKARPQWEFKGPFTMPEPTGRGSKALDPERPAAPLLFASNRLDPTTPLQSARLMASKYPGAGLLVQEAVGHCVLLSTDMTPCARKVFADYFDAGVVPDGELVCEAGRGPWDLA